MSLNSPEYLALAAEIAQAEGDLAKLTLKLDEISADAALMAGGFLPPPAGTAADVASLGKDLAAGDWGSAFWDAVGIIPIVGDGAKAAAKGGKIANTLADVKKAIEKANKAIQKKKDELNKLCKDKQVKNKEKVTEKAENCGKGDCTKKPAPLTGVAKKGNWAKSKQGEDGPGLRDHFEKHGDQVGAKSPREYDLSARETIQNGREFSYRDRSTGEQRVGYFDSKTGLFTATSQTRKDPAILTHFPETWENLRKLPGFSVK